MDVLRERDEKDNLDRQLHEERKIRASLQKRLRREKRARKRMQDQLDVEMKRRVQLEEALKSSGAAEQINIINDKIAQLQQPTQQQQHQVAPPPQPPTPHTPHTPHTPTMIPPPTPERIMERPDRIKQEIEEMPQQYVTPRDMPREQPPPPPPPMENKGWGYSGLDLMNSGAAFWQNYSDSLAQELEMERKSRQQHVEGEVKSPLQDRSGYYKNSVLFSSAT
ncbi:forkhead box protein J2-like [Sitophilus oryzae]|uniref:Forkhead box protein J2-like n=1 Tax=Sitophilus oryzae TaxID=7048 RepID=A0A6J2XIU3_SITOR|nr:forkhead box protein J2-like [Sitophilus oryzae]